MLPQRRGGDVSKLRVVRGALSETSPAATAVAMLGPTVDIAHKVLAIRPDVLALAPPPFQVSASQLARYSGFGTLCKTWT